MASLFTLRALMALATKIGANPNKFMGTRTNISFLGKGPTKNPLFQRLVPGLDNASSTNKGALIEATEDAMSYASAGKLNSIQTEILGKNMLSLDKVLNPTLATVTKLPTRGTGITTLRSNDIGAGERLYNKLTGLDKSKPFQGWTPSVVPKAINTPASKINHQMIADKYGIDVELIRGKDWVEVLEILKGFTPLKHGGLARILEV